MTDLVRVREGNWEYTLPKKRVPEGMKVLDKPATARNGKALPPKPVTPLGTPAPGSKQERQRAAKKTSGANDSGKDAGHSSAETEEEK